MHASPGINLNVLYLLLLGQFKRDFRDYSNSFTYTKKCRQARAGLRNQSLIPANLNNLSWLHCKFPAISTRYIV